MTAKKKQLAAEFLVYRPLGEMISTLFHPLAEVVLHDARSGRIAAIWNAFSDRKAGDLSNLDRAPEQFSDDQEVLGPYEKLLGQAGRTKSMTVALRDGAGATIGYFCVNLDVTPADNIIDRISAFTALASKRPDPIFRTDLAEHINYLIRDYLLSANKSLASLDRPERADLVRVLREAGVFKARNATSLVAKALQISRGSVYNLIADGRSDETGK